MTGFTENSRIQLGLPTFPDERLPPQLYSALLQIHLAMENIVRGISEYAGVDAPDPVVWPQLSYSDTLILGNATRMYPVATVAILRGQTINLFDNAGTLGARLADASSATTMMHGVANTDAAIGEQFEMYWMRALLDSIGGLTVGSIYYLSTVAGAVQSVRPAGAGDIIQSAGLALTADTLLLDCSLQYIQL